MSYDEIIMKFIEDHALALYKEPRFIPTEYMWVIGFEVRRLLNIHHDIVYFPRTQEKTIMGIKFINDDKPWTIKLYKEVV